MPNDKGRLSKDDIERMVNEAEKFRAEDEATTARIIAKDGLESYAYNLSNSLNEETFASKFELTTRRSCILRWTSRSRGSTADKRLPRRSTRTSRRSS
ncbi:unnamed protein product [Tilletia laevis]|uniref:Uncharacterized protein n=1 Tax=Tilletia caries TaxID=13290 RepID=A0A8T8SER3_9BASI|nr:hypothetical protein CF336_g8722 [Tilletia laevis]KAE8183106.1 hypothetical protein CF335_g8423 [Tilletia laevis]KAE8238284.1 hypothetical protein A4X03_0g8873 [Tilletia caries]CAD6920147.1 unnamed protein product [Tilletia laevis]CAD6953570.1 unnamed protein product [Tilletia caries]